MPDFPSPTKAQTRETVKALRTRNHAKILIVGGGINAIATFRDLALQGVDVALVERRDFASGSSAASSHMVHGGIRYLENGEFRLVRESVIERNRLLTGAPHYVKPLPTTVPIFKTFAGILAAPLRLLITHGRGKPSERGAILIKIGLTIYETFSRGFAGLQRHRFHGKRRSLRELPQLNPHIRYTASYFDASMHDPERLALDVLQDGELAGLEKGTARAANYVAAIGAINGAVTLRDEVTGETFNFKADLVINASGPWSDLTNQALGHKTSYMGGTKGSHIVLKNAALHNACRGRELFFEHSDGRIVLIYPLLERVLVGTTDIEADASKTSVITDTEIEYFFELIRHVFPAIALSRDDIVYSFSGIRPLPKHDDLAPGFVSRDYRIERQNFNGLDVLTLVGGKWTTFRALGEHISDRALEILNLKRQNSTLHTAIGGGQGYPVDTGERRLWIARHAGTGTSDRAEKMLSRYGTKAKSILEKLPAKATPLQGAPGYFLEEIQQLALNEHVVHLEDLLLRRTRIAFLGELNDTALTEIAKTLAAALGWNEKRVAEELAATRETLLREHRIIPGVKGLAAETKTP